MSKYYCLVLTIILVTNAIVHGAIVSHEYTKVHKDAGVVWDWNMAEDDQWTGSASLVESSKADMECAVRCSQQAGCKSFITSSGQCYTGTVVPEAGLFKPHDSLTLSHYTRPA